MPLDRDAEFLAVDEIQLCADPDRGHVFTDRLLHARGLVETMFLGAETIRPLLQRLVPQASVETRPRLSQLSHAGPTKLARLPPRTAVVAFSAAEVYAIAELIRRRRGGCAVVMGRLSPAHPQRPGGALPGQGGRFPGGDRRHRHGPEHGRGPRRLRRPGQVRRPPSAPADSRPKWRRSPAAPGAACATAPSAPPPIARRSPTRWRPPWRRTVSTRSTALLAQQRPRFQPRRRAAGDADGAAARAGPGARQRRDRPGDACRAGARARHPPAGARPPEVRLLWEACQIPDFRKLADDTHTRLCARVFGHIAREGRLPTDWLAGQIAALARADGDIDTLMQRLAGVRVWTYIAARADWVPDAPHWQGRAREVEDLLSDALHERLTSPLRRSPRRAPDAPAGGGRRRRNCCPRSPAAAKSSSKAIRSAISGASASCPTRCRGRRKASWCCAPRGARCGRRCRAGSRGWKRRPTPPSRSTADSPSPGRACRSPGCAAASARCGRGWRCWTASSSMARSASACGCGCSTSSMTGSRTIWRRCAGPPNGAEHRPDLRGPLHRLTEALGVVPGDEGDSLPPRCARRAEGDRASRPAASRLFLPALLKPRPTAMRAPAVGASSTACRAGAAAARSGVAAAPPDWPAGFRRRHGLGGGGAGAAAPGYRRAGRRRTGLGGAARRHRCRPAWPRAWR